MSKRSVTFQEGEDILEEQSDPKKAKVTDTVIKKHTLDSDEEDSDDQNNVLDDNEFEGEEDGTTRVEGKEGEAQVFTPFNMKQELEEGHFDRDGHYLFNKNNDIKDNWLDNIDWVKIKESGESSAQADDSTVEMEEEPPQAAFKESDNYKKIFELMKPGETIKKAIQRLGKLSKISSAERWRRKKAGIVENPSSDQVILLTELADGILTNTGNMSIYEETFEQIQRKVQKGSAAVCDPLDMYADDFDAKEKGKLDQPAATVNPEEVSSSESELKWEFKWKQEEEQIYGPFPTTQMQGWVDEGYFKDGVFVRKLGAEDSKFYSSNRIDFELYL